MNYRRVYMSIIKNAQKETIQGLRPLTKQKKKNFSEYYEFHHILPKSLFPSWANRKSNIVALTAREHFFCHQLLTKIYSNSNMFLALWWLANDGQNKYCTSREYEKLKKEYRFSESHIKNIKKASHKLWKSNKANDLRKRISESVKAVFKSDEMRYILKQNGLLVRKISLKYKEYKEHGGTLSWNEFQKSYKSIVNI